MAKAFDTISHEKLLSKLHKIGVRGSANQLIKHYLSERKQIVDIDGHRSTPRVIEYGIPQGTVLGPLLFITYINELLSLGCSGTIISYADDTVLFVEGKTWNEVEVNINSDMGQITAWFDNNLLTINKEKTTYLPFSLYKDTMPQNSAVSITLPSRNNEVWNINSTRNTKYLGIMFDSQLKWDVHIMNLTKKLRSLLYLFRQLKCILPINNLKTIYFSLVQSHLTYGISAWGSAYQNTVGPLEVLQKRIIKIILNLPIKYPTEALFEVAEILPIKKLHCKSSLLQMIRTGDLRVSADYYYPTRYRQNDNIILPKVETRKKQHTFSHVGTKLYNLLPMELKRKTKNSNFKQILSGWLLHTPINF